MKNNKYAYGIDFGTTNSTITAITRSGEPIRLEIDNEAENKAVM
jgi:molecular chaperone DnaK (HSP70)